MQQSPEPKKYIPPPPYKPPIPFPHRFHRAKLDQQFGKFIDILKKLYVNIPFTKVLTQMPTYAKFLKEILSNKRRLEEYATVALTEESSAILQNKLPPKLQDPESFSIPCQIGTTTIGRALCDLGAKDTNIPIILGRPFLATAGAIIDVKNGKMTLRVGEEEIEFNLEKPMKAMDDMDSCLRVDILDKLVDVEFRKSHPKDSLEHLLSEGL
ncbi:hypothetical protein K2173_011113 [Erythroxylum novogranatense]|uniref:Uncharacterized protein n=1 Tax=Erythroxylum novogranatense TaxID=1862640 RepID=A0AAV8U4W3_9ROSI|nr:hypothetical protein K2173_011113 [Erythroxylum novogranatense]